MDQLGRQFRPWPVLLGVEFPEVELRGCGNVAGARVLGYSGEPSGFSERKSFYQSGGKMQVMLAPWSITVLDISIARE
jgi:hypothetical protein